MNATAYDLVKVPEQSFTTNVNGHSFEFAFHTFRGITYADASVDGVLVEAGSPCIPNRSVFHGKVNEAAGGIFGFDCIDDRYPSYEDFDGHTCRFMHISFSELRK